MFHSADSRFSKSGADWATEEIIQTARIVMAQHFHGNVFTLEDADKVERKFLKVCHPNLRDGVSNDDIGLQAEFKSIFPALARLICFSQKPERI